jgi:hypothetical protein
MLLGAFRPQTTTEDKKSQPPSVSGFPTSQLSPVPLMWFSSKRTTCRCSKPQLSTGNPGKPTCPGVSWEGSAVPRTSPGNANYDAQTELSSRPERSEEICGFFSSSHRLQNSLRFRRQPFKQSSLISLGPNSRQSSQQVTLSKSQSFR